MVPILDKKEIRRLIDAAAEVRKNAYAPYSDYSVGAALLTEEGEIFCGCNQENIAFGPSLCAERAAFASAISAGNKKFRAIAVTGSGDDFCVPCGICRQVMAEFCTDDFIVLAVDNKGNYREYTLAGLLPDAFGAGRRNNG